ncbi:MAG: LamG domain-containing protein, partial [Nannocystaceae bacterium]|nr:LamG domain-containing protein [Nannocystaceae bacterium]
MTVRWGFEAVFALVLCWAGLSACGTDDTAVTGEGNLRTLDEGLLLHWTFEDRAGTQILDVSGNGRHGTLLGGGSFVSTQDGEGEGVVLDGVDDMISFAGPRAPSLYGGSHGAVTLSARVRVTDAAEYNTLCVGCGPVRSLFVGTQSFGGRIQAALRNGESGEISWHQSTDALIDNAWVQATVIVEGGVGTRMYLDCALDVEVLDSAIELDDFGYSSVGEGTAPHMWFEGGIDDLRIWDRALSSEELDALCPDTAPDEGLELHWTFEDRTETQVLDMSGNGRHGTLQGGPTFVEGAVGDAVHLDGIDDYISMLGPRDPSLYGGVEGAFTLSAHVRLSDVARYNTLCYGCGPLRTMFLGTAPYGARAMATLHDQSVGSTWPTSTPSLVADSWTEVTMVVEGGVGTRMFLDCSIDSNTPNEGVRLRDYGYSSVGQGGSAEFFYEGDIDELRVWRRALSEEEIADLCPSDPTDSLAEDLELHWTFEDRVGDTIEDLSGNGRNGTMMGGTFVSSPNGEAASLDGVDDSVSFVGPRDVSLYGGTTGDFTMSAQVRVSDVQRFNTLCFGCGPMGSVFVGDNSSNNGIYDTGNYAQAAFWGNNGIGIESFFHRIQTSTVLDEGQWFEITLVVEGGVGARIYINGVLMAEMPESNIELHDPGFSSLGRGASSGRWFGGEVDELRIWSRALSHEDVADFGEGMPFLHLGLIAKWVFAYHVGDYIFDRSGNDRFAWLEGATLVPSPNGEAAQFDGVDDFLSFSGLRDPELFGGEDGSFSLSTRLRVVDADAVNTICFGCGPFNTLWVGNLGSPGRAWARLFDQASASFFWPITAPALIADDTWVE